MAAAGNHRPIAFHFRGRDVDLAVQCVRLHTTSFAAFSLIHDGHRHSALRVAKMERKVRTATWTSHCEPLRGACSEPGQGQSGHARPPDRPPNPGTIHPCKAAKLLRDWQWLNRFFFVPKIVCGDEIPLGQSVTSRPFGENLIFVLSSTIRY